MHCYVKNFYQLFLHLRLATALAAIFFAQIFPNTWAAFARSCRPTSVGSSREEFPGRGSHCADQSGKRSRESWIIASESTVGWIRMRLIDLNYDLLPINWIVSPIHGWLPSKSLQRARESRILHRRPPWVGLEWGWDRGPGPDPCSSPCPWPPIWFEPAAAAQCAICAICSEPVHVHPCTSKQLGVYHQNGNASETNSVLWKRWTIKNASQLRGRGGGGLTLNDKSFKFKGFLILP